MIESRDTLEDVSIYIRFETESTPYGEFVKAIASYNDWYTVEAMARTNQMATRIVLQKIAALDKESL